MFAHPQFGTVRTVEISGEPWFVGKDEANTLVYQNGSRDINRHVDEEDRRKMMIFDRNQNKKQLSSTNPVSPLSSSAASFHQQKSASTGVQVKFERQGDIVKGGENFTLPEIPMII